MTKKKKNIILGGVILVLIILSFFAGLQYGKSTVNSAVRQNPMMNGNGNGFNRDQGNGGIRQRGSFTGGEVINKDDKSITIKLQDGGSKIIFFSSTTRIMKSLEGTFDDITIGEQITVTGTQNSDGSVTAQSIQTRTGITPPGR